MSTLQELIQAGETVQAIKLILQRFTVYDPYHYLGEKCVFEVLREEKATKEVVDACLQAFLDTRRNRVPDHGYWVHSLSQFTRILWARRLDDWIKRFNLVAFTGANELGDNNCSNRLIGDFAQFATWQDDPVDFHITAENISWMDWKHGKYNKSRIAAGKFASEAEFLRWQIQQWLVIPRWNGEAQTNLIDIYKIKSLIKNLAALGADISEYEGLEKELLKKRLCQLEDELKDAQYDFKKEALGKVIKSSKDALDSLLNKTRISA